MDQDNNFQSYQEGWFIEGNFYCQKHKEEALRILEETAREAEKRRLERERIAQERSRINRQVMEEWAATDGNEELRKKLEQKRRELEQRQQEQGDKKV